MSKRFAGIDIGSRTTELAVVDDSGCVLHTAQADTGFDPIDQAKVLLDGVTYDRILATGYGRGLFEINFDSPTVTEIKAHARGARAAFPEARTVLDIGGQDSKAIALSLDGRVSKFEMNDRCAAGTGRFLEMMAGALGYDLPNFGEQAMQSTGGLNISSMCAVFAESEVTTLIAKGHDRHDIARGLHESVVNRAVGMINRVSSQGEIVFTGGVALNRCMGQLLESKLGRRLLIPDQPQMTGAIGAALLAGE